MKGMVMGTGQVVDLDRAAAELRAERITSRLDTIAENYQAVMPMIRQAIEERDDLALGYRSPGEYVADRFGDSLANLGIQVRRAVVAELTEAGLSTRAIAPVVGVNNATVHRDLASGVASATRDPSNLPDDATGEEVTPSGETTVGTHGPEVEESPGSRVERSPAPRRPVTGIDGKSYTPQPTLAEKATAAVEEFPDLAYYAEIGQHRAVVTMAQDLRMFRDRGDLEERLDNLRRSIAVDRAKRDGTDRPGTTATMGPDGVYRMEPMRNPPPATSTCPTCAGRGVVIVGQTNG